MIAGISVAVANFETLSGGSRATAVLLLGSILVVFVVGLVVELRRPRRAQPAAHSIKYRYFQVCSI